MKNRELDNLTTLARRASDRASSYATCGAKDQAHQWHAAARSLQAAHDALALAIQTEKLT